MHSPQSRIPGLALALLLLVSTAAMAHAAPKSAEPQNLLKQADFSKLKNVPEIPAPWQTTAKSKGITVRMVNAKFTPPTWVQLKDESTEAAANIRQSFGDLPKGRFSTYVMANPDHTGAIGIYLGTGGAGSSADRVIDIKSDDDGRFRVGSRGKRKETSLEIKPGNVLRLWVSWQPEEGGSLDVRFGAYDQDGKDVMVARYSVAEPVPINSLRISSDTPAAGAHFLLSGLLLEAL